MGRATCGSSRTAWRQAALRPGQAQEGRVLLWVSTFSTWLGAISPSGAIQTPYNATTSTYGDQATGFGVNASANVSGLGVYTAGLVGTETGVLGIDSSGNICVLDEESFRVIKISGLATANTVKYWG